MTAFALIHIASLLFLSFDVAAVLSINDRDGFPAIARATLRRWAKLLGALLLVGLIVHVMTLIGSA